MSEITLRGYQKDALEFVIKYFQDGINSQLIVLPTGAGKTIIMAAIAKHFNKKTLILAHREELIYQTRDKIKLFWPEADIGIVKAESNEHDKYIVVASVQSCAQSKRLEQLKSEGFEILMIDEAHHAVSGSYQKVIRGLSFNEHPANLLLGVTATPNRTDRKHLGDIFTTTVYQKSIESMILEGFLCPPYGRAITTGYTLKGVKSHRDDFNQSQLARAVNVPARNEFVVQKYMHYAQNRKSIVFAVDVKHCHDLAATFKKQGLKATAIWGDMALQKRRKKLEQFRKGKLQILVSCGVLTEGYDEQSVDCIVMARPTKSEGLYIQCIGRGLRIAPGKIDCLVLDFNDNHHTLSNVMSLKKTVRHVKVIEEKDVALKDGSKIGGTERLRVIELSDEKINWFLKKRYLWVPIGNDEHALTDDNRNEIVIKPQGDTYIATVYYANGLSENIITESLSLDQCTTICEEFAQKYLSFSYGDKEGEWYQGAKHEQPTEKQIQILRKNKFPYSRLKTLSKADATYEIGKIFAVSRKEYRQKGFS